MACEVVVADAVAGTERIIAYRSHAVRYRYRGHRAAARDRLRRCFQFLIMSGSFRAESHDDIVIGLYVFDCV